MTWNLQNTRQDTMGYGYFEWERAETRIETGKCFKAHKCSLFSCTIVVRQLFRITIVSEFLKEINAAKNTKALKFIDNSVKIKITHTSLLCLAPAFRVSTACCQMNILSVSDIKTECREITFNLTGYVTIIVHSLTSVLDQRKLTLLTGTRFA